MHHFDLKLIGIFGMLILIAVVAEVANAWTKPTNEAPVISSTLQP